MKKYLIENHSTMFLVGLILALGGLTAVGSRSASDLIAYTVFIVPALFIGGGIYGAVQRVRQYTRPSDQTKES